MRQHHSPGRVGAVLFQQRERFLGVLGCQRHVPLLAGGIGLANQGPGLVDSRRLDVLAARRLNVLAPRRLDVLAARRLNVLAARRLNVLAARRLNVLAARRLNVLAARRLNVLAARRLDVLSCVLAPAWARGAWISWLFAVGPFFFSAAWALLSAPLASVSSAGQGSAPHPIIGTNMNPRSPTPRATIDRFRIVPSFRRVP